jgi:glutaredoxin
MKKILFAAFLFLFLAAPAFIFAQEPVKVEINFFYSPTCPHCAKEEKFLDDLQTRYPDITITRYSVNESKNIDLLKQYYKDYDVPQEYQGMVPATFTNSKYFVGYSDDIAKKIEECIKECQMGSSSKINTSIIDLEGNISMPLLGKINVKKYSLPLLTVILGILDGFNVCSLGALVLILGLVLAMRSRFKTLLFGGIFILTTAVIYGILISVWYKIFSLLTPYMMIMEILIGLLGVGGGIYFLKQYLKFRKYGPTCEVDTGKGMITKFSEKFHSVKDSASVILLLGMVFIFAGVITIIEFPCSAVIPVAYAGILAQSNLSTVVYLLYISLYLFFYMFDEIVVFLIAFFTMKVWLSSTKVTTWITLTEALILFILGVYYLYASVAVYIS